jgi:hypothetical protein
MRALAEVDGLLPPQIGALHQAFAAWGRAGMSPGPVTARRMWVGPAGELAVVFEPNDEPRPLGHVGLAPDLAAWLVLLDRQMETFVVIARARTVWSPAELAKALMFVTPSLLPPSPNGGADNWLRVAQALAAAVADGPLAGGNQDKHWA